MPKGSSKSAVKKSSKGKSRESSLQKAPINKIATLRDIADRAGVSRTTVSLALRNNPRISDKVTQRIKKIADELGHRPDAKLTRAMAQLGRKKREDATLGFIRSSPDGEWEYLEKFLFEETKVYADRLGYRLEPFWLFDPKTTPEKINRMMYHRGVDGLILSMLHPRLFNLGHRTLPIDWKKFCVVQIADTITREQISGVRHNHFGGMLTALSELEALGYKRIGLCMESSVDTRTHHRWTAGYLLWQKMRDLGNDLKPYFPLSYDNAKVRQWVQSSAIDAVLSPGLEVLDLLEKEGIRCPKDIGFASLDLWGESSNSVTGMNQNLNVQARIAVDILASLIQQQSRGILEHPILAINPGTWHHGSTTRKPKPKHSVSKLDDEVLSIPLWQPTDWSKD